MREEDERSFNNRHTLMHNVSAQSPWDREHIIAWVRRLAIYGAWALVILFGALFLKRDALKYLEYTPEVYERFWAVRWSLLAHVVPASVALVLAPLQFVDGVRRRWPRVHRATGWIYVACATVSVPAIYRLILVPTCGTCVPPFMVWTTLFLIVTALAVVMAVKGRYDLHRQFMIRSYVLLNGFMFLRLDTHLGFPLGNVAPADRAGVLLWVAWVVPILLTEMWLSWSPQIARGPR